MNVTRFETRRAIGVALLVLCGALPAARAELVHVSGQVVDYQARPVADAEVAIFERVYDYSISHDSGVLRDEIRRTGADGRFVLTADVTLSDINVYMIVVRKDGYALGWDWLGRVDDNVIVLERPGTIAGVLVDANGRPVAGARVQAAPKSSYLQRLNQMPVLAPEAWLTTQTDDQGAFRFETFSADVSTDFWVAAPGHALVYQFTPNRMKVYGFEVGRTDVRLCLPAEVPLQGTVVDRDSGSPVSAARVVLGPHGTGYDKSPFISVVTTSGADGRFVFDGVPPGQNCIDVSAPLESGLVDRRVTFDVAAEAESVEVTADLSRGGTIELAAREQGSGQPISGLIVRFWQAVQNERSDFYKDVRTDAEGLIRIQAPAGECAIRTRSDRYLPMFYEGQVPVSAGQTAKAEIVLERYLRVSGLVLDEAGQPVAGAMVSGALRPTDPAGRFEARLSQDEPPSVWIVRHVQRNLAAVLSVGDIRQSPEITLKPALSVSGTVTDPDGQGISAARVALTLRIPGFLMPYAPEVASDSDGRFEIRAIAPLPDDSSYRISADASGYGSVAYQRAPIETGPEEHAEIGAIVLIPANQTISGVVHDSDGNPVPDAQVAAWTRGRYMRNAVTDGEGRFVISRVPRESLRIQADLPANPDGAGFLQAEGGDQDVTVILGQEGVHLRYASLAGKPLPDGNEIGLDFSRADWQGKRLVLCFFDYLQRPSRNTLLQLAGQADALAQRNAAVVAVQASEVEPGALEAWAEQVGLAVPVGAIAGDVETTRLAWGVKALPWLILTDGDHIVRAEGFVVGALDEELGRIVGQ